MHPARSHFLPLLLAVSLAGCDSETQPAPVDEEAGVRAAYEGYQSAILDGKGELATEFVDRKTIEYYQRLRDVAFSAPKAEVEALRTIDLMTVLLVRHRMEPEVVAKMNGRDLFIYAIDHEWIGKAAVVNNSLGDVVVKGNSASGVHVTKGKPSPIRWTFRKEDGSWRLDLTSIMPMTEAAFGQMIEQSGESRNEFLFRIMNTISETQLTDAVWEPMAK